MNKTLLVALVLITVLLLTGGRIVRNVLVTTVNTRMDSSEAIVINEIDSRIYKDFSRLEKVLNVENTEDSFEYTVGGETVRIRNHGETVRIEIIYADGNSWVGAIPGSIKVNKVEVLNINNHIKVDLSNTLSQLYAITYKHKEDWQKGRVTLNRNFTRYLAIP